MRFSDATVGIRRSERKDAARLHTCTRHAVGDAEIEPKTTDEKLRYSYGPTADMRRCACNRMHGHVCTHLYRHAFAHVYAHAYTRIYTHAYTHFYIHVCTHVHAHIYTHVYPHVYTHVQTQALFFCTAWSDLRSGFQRAGPWIDVYTRLAC